METKNSRNNYLKYVAILLVIVFIVAASFLLLELWEDKQSKFPDISYQDDVLEYNGQEYVYKENIETFLVIGLDRYDDSDVADSHDSGVQADFLMLFVLDNDTMKSSAIQINRDTMTKVNKLSVGGTTVVDSYIRQIALAYNYANDDNDKIRCRNTKDSVEFLLKNVDIDHYMAVTINSVPESCDLVGGVEITVLDDFTGIDDSLIKGETVTLTGEQALTYIRTRYGLEDSTNIRRMERQQQYLTAFYQKVLSCMDNDSEFIVNMIETLDKYVVYDSSNYRMQKIAEKLDDYEFLGIREIEGESKLGEEFMEFYPDEASIYEIVIDLFYTPKMSNNKN